MALDYAKLGKISRSKSKQGRARFLLTFRLSGDFQKAVVASGVKAQTVNGWKRDDDRFRRQFDDIEAIWSAYAADALNGLTMKAVAVLENTLDNPEVDDRVRNDVAWKLLRSLGHVQDKTVTETTTTEFRTFTLRIGDGKPPAIADTQYRVIEAENDHGDK